MAAHRAIDFKRVQFGAAIPNLEGDPGTVKFDPGIRACQGMHEALQVNFPCTNQEVKIVLPIPFRGNVLIACFDAPEFCCANPLWGGS